jgi:perosamine synthetase
MNNPSKFIGNELKYITKVLNSENWSGTTGNWNQTFEKLFCEKIGVRHGIAMNSGTSTLHCALEALGVEPGDEVITPALTVIMDSNAIIHANAVPVFVDIDPKTFNLSVIDLKRKITPKTKAIIAVAIYGLSPDYDEIKKVAGNIPIIEDNAQCLLGTYKGNMTGGIGQVSSYSFENTKHISCGEGGIVCTNDEQIATKLRKIGGHGFKNLVADEGRIRLNQEVFQDPNYKRHDVIGWNYRMSEFNAAIAMAQLERVDELVNLRKESANIFIQKMKKYNIFEFQESAYESENVYYTLGVIYEGESRYGVSWHNFRKKYVEMGGDGIYGAWSVPYLEPVMQRRDYVKRYPEIYKDIYYKAGDCPIAEKIQQKIMQFKSNYRSLELAEQKSDILDSLMKGIVNGNIY